ncbi:hypothetical protein MKK75_03375 [Methylobacterium sp. J-030]|uniref:hypothetical protein n=1 Tax=Methylobacterium sp. J-030 TaxID=2836627 RepID=UPI001FBA2951|nr:hypothetical protein [Methylobacterium sp. J-030]MCJ2067858.1 hypothetical protein [Methylobacterium sp. J-030]
MTDGRPDDGAEASGVEVESVASPSTGQRARRRRVVRPFPGGPFEESVEFARQIYQFSAGQPVRKLTFFDHLSKSPESSVSRDLLTNANKYGLLKGSFAADPIELTEAAKRILSETGTASDKIVAKAELGITQIEIFSQLYTQFQGNRLPGRGVLIDALRAQQVPQDFIEEGVDTFVLNLRYAGLLQTLSGADRIVSLELALEHVALERASPVVPPGFASAIVEQSAPQPARARDVDGGLDNACFYITPIGEVGSPERRHSDLMMGSIIEPALAQFGLKVVRADAMTEPGMITRQIIEYIMRARLVVADLSFHNPNVFYELAFRHAIRKPIVQLIRTRDRIPFDVGQMRTIVIDDTDIYTFVPKIEAYRSDVASHIRRALEEGYEVETPLSTYFPSFSGAVAN